MRIQIEHRIGVQAPASEVWRHLSELEAWGDWNPMYPQAAGQLLIGATLSLTERVPGREAQTIAPSVVDWVPDAQIVWALKGPMLVRRTRYMELQKLTDDACVFSNGEIYEGLGVRFLPKGLRRALRQGFTDLGEALKARTERAAAEPAR